MKAHRTNNQSINYRITKEIKSIDIELKQGWQSGANYGTEGSSYHSSMPEDELDVEVENNFVPDWESLIDEKTFEMAKNIQTRFNLGSLEESLRMLIAVGSQTLLGF